MKKLLRLSLVVALIGCQPVAELNKEPPPPDRIKVVVSEYHDGHSYHLIHVDNKYECVTMYQGGVWCTSLK